MKQWMILCAPLISVDFWIPTHKHKIAGFVFCTAKEMAAKSDSLDTCEYRGKTSKCKLEEITRSFFSKDPMCKSQYYKIKTLNTYL